MASKRAVKKVKAPAAIVPRRGKKRVALSDGQLVRFNLMRAHLRLPIFVSKVKAEYYLGAMEDEFLVATMERIGADVVDAG